MPSCPNRSDKREIQLFNTAEDGKFHLNDFLYPCEMKKLEKEGFKIYNVKPSNKQKGLYRATIDWSQAYSNGIPPIVYSYMTDMIVTKPEKHIKTFAQKLFVIAYRIARRK